MIELFSCHLFSTFTTSQNGCLWKKRPVTSPTMLLWFGELNRILERDRVIRLTMMVSRKNYINIFQRWSHPLHKKPNHGQQTSPLSEICRIQIKANFLLFCYGTPCMMYLCKYCAWYYPSWRQLFGLVDLDVVEVLWRWYLISVKHHR